MAAVFLRRRRADDLYLAAPQRGLEDVGRVDRALGAARPDERVQLVDEEDHVAGAAHLAQHGLDALLEVAAVLRPRKHRGDVQRDQTFFRQLRRRRPARHQLGQALRHGRFAHAGLADENGIVLRAARKDLHRAADLLFAADDRVDPTREGERREVAAVLVERARLGAAQRPRPGRGGAGLGGMRHGAAAEEIAQRGGGGGEVGPAAAQQPHRAAVAVAEDREQQMLRADQAPAAAPGFAAGGLQQAGGLGVEPLRGRAGRSAAQLLRRETAQRFPVGAAAAQYPLAERVRLGEDTQQEMLAADEAVAESRGLGARVFDRAFGALRENLVALHGRLL